MFSLNCNGCLRQFTTPVAMGIINATPDSFYAASRQANVAAVLQQAEKMVEEGATFLDIGGQSTRPGSSRVPADEERTRVLPCIEAVAKRFPQALISIDTYYASVAREAVAAGAHLVNDVSAGTMDEMLWPAVAALKVPYVLMHLQGTLNTMQQSPQYDNVVLTVTDFFAANLHKLHALGIADVILDPGFGFGKTAAHNFTLLNALSFFKLFQNPMLVGLSRKATVYKTLGISAAEALNGTTVLHTKALLGGAQILRVHDVRAAVEAITLVGAMERV